MNAALALLALAGAVVILRRAQKDQNSTVSAATSDGAAIDAGGSAERDEEI